MFLQAGWTAFAFNYGRTQLENEKKQEKAEKRGLQKRSTV